MHISQEKLDEFQARMSNWIASQGLFFQLRHAGGVQGAHSSLFLWFVRMAARLFVLAAVVAVVFWIYLSKRIDFAGFRAELNEQIAAGLGADSATAGGLKRTRGYLELSKMTLTGGERSFFSEAEARGVRTKMGLLDGVLATWDGEAVSIERLEMKLKSGAESEEAGAEMFGRLFRHPREFRFSQVEVGQATLRWGYSGVTAGSIEDARIRAIRKDEGWSVDVTGGLFSQNWLQELEIVSMNIQLRPDGIELREAHLKRGRGEVNFKLRVDGPATHPVLSGSGTMQGLSIDAYLTSEVREYLGGDLSGTFTIGGSPYAATGVSLKADITLEGDDRIELRDRLPLFRSVSVVDRFRSYKNVRFTTGRFTLETGNNKAVITDIWLQANEVMRLEGWLVARRPTREEVDELLKSKPAGAGERAGKPVKGVADVDSDQDTFAAKELTLKDAVEAANQKGQEEAPPDPFPMRIGLQDQKLLEIEEAARAAAQRIPMLQGAVQIGLNAQAFERASELVLKYPIDSQTHLRWLELRLDGSLSEASVGLAEQILDLSEER